MKDGFVRVGCASFDMKLGNVKANADQIIKYAHKASEEHFLVSYRSEEHTSELQSH